MVFQPTYYAPLVAPQVAIIIVTIQIAVRITARTIRCPPCVLEPSTIMVYSKKMNIRF